MVSMEAAIPAAPSGFRVPSSSAKEEDQDQADDDQQHDAPLPLDQLSCRHGPSIARSSDPVRLEAEVAPRRSLEHQAALHAVAPPPHGDQRSCEAEHLE
jgi:hypothetical protein